MPLLLTNDVQDWMNRVTEEVQRLARKVDNLQGPGISNDRDALSIHIPPPPPDAPIPEDLLPFPRPLYSVLMPVSTNGVTVAFDGPRFLAKP